MTPALHTYRVQFHPGERNYCPGCGGSHWWVGCFSAECARCATAIEITGRRRGGGTLTGARLLAEMDRRDAKQEAA